jgi:hypothetical protein
MVCVPVLHRGAGFCSGIARERTHLLRCETTVNSYTPSRRG